MNDEKRKEVTPRLLRYILQDDLSQEEKDVKSIAAEEITEAINQGKKVEIVNAVIDGPFTLRSTTIESEVTIERTKFRDIVDCSYAVYNQVVSFSESVFEADTVFTMATVHKDIFLDGATFWKRADFHNLTVAGWDYSWNTIFKTEANFNSAQIEGAARFERATFEGEANFVGARIGTAFDFVEAVFKKNANFNVTQINGTGGFIQTTFEGDVDFRRVRIAGAAHFTKAVFKANVGVRSAGQALFADERLTIQNIFRKKDTVKDTSKAGTSEPNAMPQESAGNLFDVVVTCNEGLVVRPMDSPSGQPDLLSSVPSMLATMEPQPTYVAEAADINSLRAKTVNYDVANRQAVATGPVKVIYHTKDRAKDGNKVTVTISAKDKLTFLPDSRQVVFEGDCLCTYVHHDRAKPRKYTLTAPKITATLAAVPSGSDEPAYLQHILAEGGVIAAMHDTLTARKYTLSAPEVAVDIASSTGGVFGSSGIDYLTAGDNAVIVVTPLNSVTELARFTASRIKYAAISESIVADGPCVFTFYANDFMPTQALGAAVPVQINAKQNTTFLPAQNKLIFEGDCICTMLRSKLDSQNKYTLSAPKITLDLSRQQREDSAASALGIDRFTADGRIVQISSVKTVSDRLVAFNKIKCKRFIYDTAGKLFTAIGPGVITVDNSNIEEPKASTSGLSITRRCYAFLRDFTTLDFDLEANRIIARNSQTNMLADYFPVVDGQNSQQIKASAGAIEIQLASTNGGTNEISSLKAFEGITYEDADNQFIANEMFYDATTSLVKAYGSDFHRCYLNGAVVDNIVYDLNRRAVINIDITDPGRVQALK